MIFDIGDRGTGKTERIVDWWLEDVERRVIIVSTYYMAGDVYATIARKLDSSWPAVQHVFPYSVVTMSRFLNGELNGFKDLELAFDNIDMILQSITQHKVDRVTARTDD